MPDQHSAEQVREWHAAQPSAVVHRQRRKGRPVRATARFDEDEWAAVCEAARRAGLTPRGWLACVGVAVAHKKPPPRARMAEATMVELAATRKQLVRVGTLLNQSVKATNASGEVAPGLPYLAGRVEVLLRDLDRLTAALVQK